MADLDPRVGPRRGQSIASHLAQLWDHASPTTTRATASDLSADCAQPPPGGSHPLVAEEQIAAVRVVRVVDMHTEGEPLRIVVGGLEEAIPPAMPGDILARRRFVQHHCDRLRTALMWEPRGHRDMYGCLLFAPHSPTAHVGVLFLHNEGYSSMCGHGIIALTKLWVEAGLPADRLSSTDRLAELRIDSPAGLITAHAHLREDSRSVEKVSFVNVPSFAYKLDVSLKSETFVPLLGKDTLTVDIGFGGAFYVYVSTDELGLPADCIVPKECDKLKRIGVAIKQAAMSQIEIKHPFEEDLSFLYGTIITGLPHNSNHHSRNVCVFADGEIDRSPTGTGVSGRLALLHARNQIELSQPIVIESIIGTTFSGSVSSITRFGSYEAILPCVSGTAFITGRSEMRIDPSDPLCYGFLL